MAKSLQETLSGQMQHDYFPVRLGDMASQTKYVGLAEDIEQGFWVGEEDAPTNIRVTSKYLNHSVLTLGYKLEEFVQIPQSNKETASADSSLDENNDSDKKQQSNRKRAKHGVSMAYITDHEPFDHSLAKGGVVDSALKNKAEHSLNPLQQPPLSADESHVEFFKNVDVLFHDSQYLWKEYGPDSPTPKEYWGHSTVEYVVEVAYYANVKQLLLFHHDPQRNDDQMDDIVEFAKQKALELEEQYGSEMDKLYGKARVPLKVNAAKEGGVYELDPSIYMEDEGIDIDAGKVLEVEPSPKECEMLGSDSTTKQTVLLGLLNTDAKPICDVLTNTSENAFDVVVLQDSQDVLQYAMEHQPSVLVLDEHLFGGTAFEVCEEIRNFTGAWGKQVSLMIIASPKECNDEGDAKSEAKEQQIADRLNVEDYIQGPFSPSYLLTRIQVSLLRMPLRWRRAPYSSRESQRLATLQSTGLLDSEPEERFDRITRLCSTMFNVPISLVSLVDQDRQWFKSNTGLPGAIETPRDHAFCAHAILEDGIMVIPDALQDARFADNPLVAGNPKIRFYAGCPINVASNSGGDEKHPIGTLCVIDSKPRDLRKEELRALKDFGAMVEDEIRHGAQQNGSKI